ncbi:uncharacterized protein LOC131659607 [Vicia villosa]|uniref:uncharacterized protein LOC131659607 n=1 Tax=Vicia villosa TaxID=3911 RepID=UPI00273B0692|nr:uncharacterized protein LOC131659607 [Vicia villosa]
MGMDTPASGSVTTTYVCSRCPLTIFGKRFGMDLACLPLHQIDVILGMSWWEFNYVHITCYTKIVMFPNFSGDGGPMFLSAKQVRELLEDEAAILAMFASLQVDGEATSVDFLVVYEFPNVFPSDISDLHLEREIDFTIELVLGTSPMPMAPYRMSASELRELKKQLE